MALTSRFRVRRSAARRGAQAVLLASGAFALPLACSDSVTSKVPVEVTLTIMSGNNQSAEVATALAGLLVVRVTDALGAPQPRVVVRFERVGGGQSSSVATDANGFAMARWTLSQRAGLETISASAVGPNVSQPVDFSVTAVPAAPSLIESTSDGFYAGAGSQLDTLRVSVRDRFSNLTPFVPISWSVTPAQGSIRPLSSTTDGAGAARAIWTLGESEGPQSLSISSGNATKVLV